MTEIFAEQLTAVANVVLAVFAIATAVLALLAWLKQSKEVSDQAEMLELQRRQLDDQRRASEKQAEVLELQAIDLRESLDERKQSAAQRRREQAVHVFLTEQRRPSFPNSPVIGAQLSYVTVTVANNSHEPVYEAQLHWHLDGSPYGDPNPEDIGTVLPGDNASKTRNFPQGTDLNRSGAALEFRDAAGIRWLRSSGGDLAEVP